jgi:signal-transduction protein with cAMP-binding, CBS, and nucleotidyltransferase domain
MSSLIRVKDLLRGKNSKVVQIDGAAPAQECARLMIGEEVGSLLVMEKDKLAGIITWHDLIQALAERGDAAAFATASELKSTALSTTDENAKLEVVEARMTEEHIRHMPVLRGTQIVGVVTMVDVLRLHLDRSNAMSETLHDYVSGVIH